MDAAGAPPSRAARSTARPPSTVSTVSASLSTAPSTPVTAMLAPETTSPCEMPSLDVDPSTGVDPVLYAGSPTKSRFQRKPPHLDRARECAAHAKSHHAARATVAMLSERHRARETEQEESFERAAKRDVYRTRFVETRLATNGAPTLNTVDVRIAREREHALTNQRSTSEKQPQTNGNAGTRVREAIRRAYGSQELDLKALELVHIPPQVFTTLLLQLGRFISHVNVSRNALREIPEAFVRAFPQVSVVNYKENALDTLPTCMDALTGLEELHVECNQLRRLPRRLPTTLRCLVGNRNRLTTVPNLHALIHLVELDLSHNHLELLPPGMAYLSKLTKLVVSSNRLVSLALLPKFLVSESKQTHKSRDDDSTNDDNEDDDDDDDAASWTRERIDREQKKWRVDKDPLTGDAVYFHVAHKRVARVKPKCFRAHVPMLALGKTAAVAKQRKTHAQWLALFPDGWEVTLGGECINKLGGAVRGATASTGSRPVIPASSSEAAEPPALQSLALAFTHHLTDETFTSSIPAALDKWGELHRLQALHIGGNQLVELPASIGKLVQLKLLDAEHNRILTLPDSFHEMRALETVRLAMNALAWLPPSFCALPALTDLDLKLNRFEGLPEEVGALARLKVLDLSSNSLQSLPKALLALKKLATLRLQGNQALVTSGILRPETLASGDIPQVFWHLSHQLLVEQQHGGHWPPASESQIVGVGNEVWSTNHHVHRAFTKAIASAQQSHTLDFHWKHLGFSQFPAGFFTSLGFGLRELRLSGQSLDVIPAAFAQVCGALRVLHLRKNKIHVLEDGVFDCESRKTLPLEELDLEYNELTALPRSMGMLTSLRVLRASNNKLTQEGIPTSFAQLTQLEELHLSHNRFTQPSATFGALVAMETLDLSYNQLTTLASMAFAPLQRLRLVRVSINALVDVPEELAQAPIAELYIAGNQLDALPATVLLLKTTLRVLRMQSNKISRLPLAFGELAALETVEADGNPFRSPPPEIMSMGIGAIRTYLRKRHARVLEIQRLLTTGRFPFDQDAFAQPRLGRVLVRDPTTLSTSHASPLAFLTEKHLAAFERALDAYVNGAFYLPPTASVRGADLVTQLLLQKQFFLAQRHRALVLRDLVKLCALIREKKWLDKVDFRFDLARPWGRLGELCQVYTLNPRALYDDTPALPSVLSVVRKRVYHGFEGEAFGHSEATVCDAIEHYVGVYGPVGVCHDDVPFKCGCEELLRFHKKHEPCFRPGWSVVQVVYTQEEADRRVSDDETIERAVQALRPQVEAFLKTQEGEKRFHKEVKSIKTTLRKELKAQKKKLKLLQAKYDKEKKQRALESKKKNRQTDTLTVAEVHERAEQEDKYKNLGERVQEATHEYQKGTAQLGQGYAAFLDDVVGVLIQKIGVEVRNHIVQQQRQRAIEFGLRRPWDGPNGRDFEAYKQLVRRRMLGDGSMEREDGGVNAGDAVGIGGAATDGAGGGGPQEVAGSDNSDISDVSFDGYEDLVSNLKAPDDAGDDGEDDDEDDEDDDEEEENEEARAAAVAKLEVSDVSDDDNDGGSQNGKGVGSEDSDL